MYLIDMFSWHDICMRGTLFSTLQILFKQDGKGLTGKADEQ